jgi:hypothetical protein
MKMNPRIEARLWSGLHWLLLLVAWFATLPIFPQTTFGYDRIQTKATV